jgi:hypothetical protein
MSSELDALLARAAGEIESSAGPLGTTALAQVRRRVHRRRVVRHVGESVAGVAAAGAVGTVVWIGMDRTPTPPAGPTPTVTSPAPSADPTPTQTTPAGPVKRSAKLSDADVLAHLANPRTGETWHSPQEAPADVKALLGSVSGLNTVLSVGERGDATIYAVVLGDKETADITLDPAFAASVLLYEVDADGARMILCPSARTGDRCLSGDTYGVPDGVELDEDTFYDSLTLPSRITVGDWTASTDATRELALGTPYGDGTVMVGAEVQTSLVAELGLSSLVEVRTPGLLGTTNVAYAIASPFGSLRVLDERDLPGGDVTAITWDNGLRAPDDDVLARSPGALACTSATVFGVVDQLDASAWTPGGTTADGATVYLPTGAGLTFAKQVRDLQEKESGTIKDGVGTVTGADAYGIGVQEFLDEHGVYAVDGPGGERLVALRSDMAQVVFECV